MYVSNPLFTDLNRPNMKINHAFYLKWCVSRFVVSLSELRVCKSCGNVFAKRAGVTIITSCPHCDGTNFDTISSDEELM